MKIGAWEVDIVSGGWLKADGGAMFGVVPKPLWERRITPDAQNRVPLATHCLLARNGEHTVLIDTACGGYVPDKIRAVYGLEPGQPLLENLSKINVALEDVDVVMLGHLHFDHAGGAVQQDANGKLVPTFPNATCVVSRIEWETATADRPDLRGSYVSAGLLPLAEAGKIRFIDQDEEILPGLTAIMAPGHTRGHYITRLDSEGTCGVFLGDLCPSTNHLQVAWCAAYDLDLLETRRHKRRILNQAADEGWTLFWCHDIEIAAGKIKQHNKRDFEVAEILAKATGAPAEP